MDIDGLKSKLLEIDRLPPSFEHSAICVRKIRYSTLIEML